MEHYHIINERFPEADDGYIFKDKIFGCMAKMVCLCYINGYDCIPEPQPEPEQEDENNGESDVSV